MNPLLTLFNIFKVRTLFNADGFLKGFSGLQDDPTFADATLVCEGQKLPCHRVILASKSEVFKTMFSPTGFKEGNGHFNIFDDKILLSV